MELFLLLTALLLAAIAVTVVYRRHRTVSWNRELEQAFGPAGTRDLAHHRRL